jgi:NADH:ubiquinone oxidoreductase subunit 4 (subunit M)
MFGDSFAVFSGILFSATHAFLSALMFFIVDCIYRRFHSRSVVEVTGILHLAPNLGVSIFIMIIFFAGLPGTIKFISEFYIFSGLLSSSFVSCVLLLFFANVLGLIGFSKNWYNAIFGMNTKVNNTIFLDLTFKETYVILYCFFFLFFFSFFPSYFY